jgi:hypothetical protein
MGRESDAENAPAEPNTESEQATSTAPGEADEAEASASADLPAAEAPAGGAPAAEASAGDAPATDAPATDAPAAEAPRKKKKKKKKRAESTETAEPRERGPAYAADGSERPAFVLDFPDDPELAKVTAAFEAGNYAYVREHATELAERSENAAVKRAATELLTRIEPDPLIRFLLGVSVVLLLFLTYYAYANHGH